jgi:subtilisin family serine protease
MNRYLALCLLTACLLGAACHDNAVPQATSSSPIPAATGVVADSPAAADIGAIVPPEKPRQFDRIEDLGTIQPQLVEATRFIRADQARAMYGVTGNGLTVAVLDTGLFATHRDFDFGRRVPLQLDFTTGSDEPATTAPDRQGHGTNVGGIIVANGKHRDSDLGNIGIAPGALIIPMKVLSDNGSGSYDAIARALEWIVADASRTHPQYRISAVNMSLGSSNNGDDDATLANDRVATAVRQLAALNIPVVVAAGNGYYEKQIQGMAYPAIIHETVSVGAVFDADGGRVSYASGAVAESRAAGQLTPFSQRLHESFSAAARATRTDIFAPGAPITSTGLNNPDTGVSTQHGTSQAAPVTAGVILLMQQYYESREHHLPTVEQLVTWLRAGAVGEKDADKRVDNVRHTGLEFPRIDALQALQQVDAATKH